MVDGNTGQLESKRIKCSACESWFTLLEGKDVCTVCGAKVTGSEEEEKDFKGGVDPIKEVE